MFRSGRLSPSYPCSSSLKKSGAAGVTGHPKRLRTLQPDGPED